MNRKKDYTVTQEQLARFAKALGHPPELPLCTFWQSRKRVISGIFTKNFYCQSNRFPTLERVERCRAYTRRGGNAQSKNIVSSTEKL